MSPQQPEAAYPQVSVCMATYNGERFLREQVASILSELRNDDELVVVDDASTDGTVSILRTIDDPRVRIVESPTNRGYVRTFEEVLRQARGEFLLLADQDDVWVPGRVGPMVSALRHVDVVATNLATLGGPAEICGPYGQRDWNLRATDSGRHLKNVIGVLAGNRPYYGCAMGVRRGALDGVLPFPDFVDESHDLWIALYGNLAGSIAHLDDRTVQRRFHDENATPDKPRGLRGVAVSRFKLVRSVVVLAARVSRRS